MTKIQTEAVLRYGAIYGALYLGTGIATPFMPSWFGEVGLQGAQIGIVLALPMLARIITGPLLALWADGFDERRTPVFLLALLASGSLLLLFLTDQLFLITLLWFVAATAIAGMSPLIDVVVLRRAARQSFAYSAPRGIGSVAYIAGSVGAGFLLVPFGPTAAVAGAAVATFITALAVRTLLPADATHEGGVAGLRERFSAFGLLLADRYFLLVIATAGVLQGSNAYYYGFSALLWREQGIAPWAIGGLWGFGVAIEVAFLWLGESFRKRLGAEHILVLAAGASILRWSILATSPPLWALWPLQALHALTLSAPFLASLQLVERTAPERTASAAQQLNAALASGVMLGSATLAGGLLFEKMGTSGYWIMTVMGGLGLIGAIKLSRIYVNEFQPL